MTEERELVSVCAAEGNAAEAEQLYRQALETIGRSGYVLQRMDINRDFGRFLIDRGRASEARPRLEEMRQFYNTPVATRAGRGAVATLHTGAEMKAPVTIRA